MLLERWARCHFRSWSVLPAFTGRPSEAKKQRAVWWCEIPREASGDSQVKLRFRSLDEGSVFRCRGAISTAEELATWLWRELTADPIVELGRLQWFESEGQIQIDKIATEQLELRRLRRAGDLSQPDFEAVERVSYVRLEGWEEMQVAVRTRWDELLEEMVASPRSSSPIRATHRARSR